MTENKNNEIGDMNLKEFEQQLIETNKNQLGENVIELILNEAQKEFEEIKLLKNENIKNKRILELGIILGQLSKGSLKNNELVNEYIGKINKIVDKSTAGLIRATMDILYLNNNKIIPEEEFADKPFYKDRNDNILFREKNTYDSVMIIYPENVKIAIEILNEWYKKDKERLPLTHEEIEKLINDKK